MTQSWSDDPSGEDEELWREQVVNDAVAGEHVLTDDELDLDALENEGLSEIDEEEDVDDLDEEDLSEDVDRWP